MTNQDIYLFGEGTHGRLYEQLGCHLEPGGQGARFAVWAPNAHAVSLICDCNGWDSRLDRFAPRADGSGIWEGSVPGVRHGQSYKFRIATAGVKTSRPSSSCSR